MGALYSSLMGLLAAAALVTGPAIAADIPVKAPPRTAVVAFSWTGCYVGGNVGYIRTDTSGYTSPNAAAPGFAGFTPAFLAMNSHSYGLDASSATAGGQIGCNWQSPSRWIVGLEGDINWSGAKRSVSVAYPIICFGCPTEWGAHTETLTHKLDWFSTVRARLGFPVWERTMLYATGGLAIGHVKTSYVYRGLGGLQPGWLGDDSATRLGWTAGGGVEHAFAGNWSVKLEYLYIDLGSTSISARFDNNPCCPAGANNIFDAEFKTRAHIARLGLNYQFGRRP
jgi:outer membrane immunogenic protein